MIKIAIVEDDKNYSDILESYVSRFSQENDVAIKVEKYPSGEQFLFSYELIYDLIFMDIELPGIDGMTTAGEIRKIDSEVIIIFVTNMAQYAISGYKVQAKSYILKPISYYSFSIELMDAINSIKKKNTDSILIQTEDGLKKLMMDDIYYIEVQRHQIFFHTTTGILKIRDSMKNIETLFTEKPFARCNVSFLINLAYVDGIADGAVQINGENLPISRSKRKDFITALSEYIGGGIA